MKKQQINQLVATGDAHKPDYTSWPPRGRHSFKTQPGAFGKPRAKIKPIRKHYAHS